MLCQEKKELVSETSGFSSGVVRGEEFRLEGDIGLTKKLDRLKRSSFQDAMTSTIEHQSAIFNAADVNQIRAMLSLTHGFNQEPSIANYRSLAPREGAKQ